MRTVKWDREQTIYLMKRLYGHFQIDDLVWFRAGRPRKTICGFITELDVPNGRCVIMRDGKAYKRHLCNVERSKYPRPQPVLKGN